MRRLTLALLLTGGLAVTAWAEPLHQDKTGRWVNSEGGNLYGDSNLNWKANPDLNWKANPDLNWKANPDLNSRANPNLNSRANPDLNWHGD